MASEAKEDEKRSSDEAEGAEDKEEKEAAASDEEAEEKNVAGGGGMEGERKKKRGRKPKGEPAEKKAKNKSSASGEEAKRVERPSRERKTVERFSASSPQKASATKAVSIKEGTGIKLKDIPNVFYKISKRKADENLQLLHTILFVKRAKALYLKRNIYQFSGFVWTENEEKQRAKMKEKLDKCVKDKLLDFCDVLDIPVSKATTKKEEISAKLLEFLESPYITRDVVLAEKEQRGKKRRRRTKEMAEARDVVSDKEAKKQKKSLEVAETKRGSKRSARIEEEDEDEGGSADSEGAASDEQNESDEVQESDGGKSESEDEGDEPEQFVEKDKVSAQKSTRKRAKSNVKEKTSTVESGKSPSKSPSKKAIVAAEGEARVSQKSRKRSSKEQDVRGEKALTMEKAELAKKGSAKFTKSDSNPPAASKTKGIKNKIPNHKKPSIEDNKVKGKAKSGLMVSAKEQGKGRASGKAELEPTREEMHAVVSDILKEVDFNTATLADILRQLGSHFSMDLMHRKIEVKSIIEEVINNMTDDEEDGEDEDDNAEGQEEDAEDSEKDDDA